MASVIGASGGNSFGMVGVAPGSTVVPLRIGSALSLSLLGSSSSFRNAALRFAVEQKLQVVTASWVGGAKGAL